MGGLIILISFFLGGGEGGVLSEFYVMYVVISENVPSLSGDMLTRKDIEKFALLVSRMYWYIDCTSFSFSVNTPVHLQNKALLEIFGSFRVILGNLRKTYVRASSRIFGTFRVMLRNLWKYSCVLGWMISVHLRKPLERFGNLRKTSCHLRKSTDHLGNSSCGFRYASAGLGLPSVSSDVFV